MSLFQGIAGTTPSAAAPSSADVGGQLNDLLNQLGMSTQTTTPPPNIPEPSGTLSPDQLTQYSNLISGLVKQSQQAQQAVDSPEVAAQKAAGAQQAYLNSTIPGYQSLLQQSLQNTQQQLAGQVPQDVQNQIAQAAAERGVSTGMPGAPASNAAMLQALGQTSMQQQQTGTANLQALMKQLAPDVSQFVVTPAQQEQVNATIQGNILSAATQLVSKGIDRQTALDTAAYNAQQQWYQSQAALQANLKLGVLDAAKALITQQMSDQTAIDTTTANNAAALQRAGLNAAEAYQASIDANATELQKTQAQIQEQLTVAQGGWTNNQLLQSMSDATTIQNTINQLNGQMAQLIRAGQDASALQAQKDAANYQLQVTLEQMNRIKPVTTIAGTIQTTYDPLTGQTYQSSLTGQPLTQTPNNSGAVNWNLPIGSPGWGMPTMPNYGSYQGIF